MLLLVLLAFLAVIAFGVGSTLHWLFVFGSDRCAAVRDPLLRGRHSRPFTTCLVVTGTPLDDLERGKLDSARG